MRNKTVIDRKKRVSVLNFEIYKLLISFFEKYFSVKSKFFLFFIFLKNKQRNKGSASFVKNRCILSGRGNAIYRGTKLSRIKMRELFSFGRISGWIKSSW